MNKGDVVIFMKGTVNWYKCVSVNIGPFSQIVVPTVFKEMDKKVKTYQNLSTDFLISMEDYTKSKIKKEKKG